METEPFVSQVPDLRVIKTMTHEELTASPCCAKNYWNWVFSLSPREDLRCKCGNLVVEVIA